MIDLKTLSGRTSGASAVLLEVNGLNVRARERTAVSDLARSSVVGTNPGKLPGSLWVCFFPSSQKINHLLFVLLRPSLRAGAVTGRIGCAAPPRAGGHVTRVSLVPSFASLIGALNANAVRNKTSILMPVSARLALSIVDCARRACGNAVRMFRLFGCRFQCIADRAGSTQTVRRVSLADVPIFARLSGKVETFVRRACGFSLRYSAHRPLAVVSNTLIAQPA